MEDMARIGLIEQYIRDSEKFVKTLYELLSVLKQILENPHDYDLREIKNDILLNAIPQNEAMVDYLKHIGFKLEGNKYVYPKELSLNNLRLAQASIERKIYFISGSLDPVITAKSKQNLKERKPNLAVVRVLTTNNSFLLNIESMFNTVLRYEDDALQELARQQIPLVTLQLKAIDRMREHQRQLKAGEIKGHDMTFDVAQLIELLGWFKHNFFTWMDKPECERCGGQTVYQGAGHFTDDDETCRLEMYKCQTCSGKTNFPRYNNPATLLRTRRGRCGEWANCFALLCRALGYDARYVYDATDHVWCEVFDYDSNRWIHVDPCENVLDTPLMYCHGWGKKLSYVIAFSRDDLQDVTWRYTMNHKEVLTRRNSCTETELISCVLQLRARRQRDLSEPRRRYLARRNLSELVQLMVERKPGDYESRGRMSGAAEWRRQRGECGGSGETGSTEHVFKFNKPGRYTVRYYITEDKYRVYQDEVEVETLSGWQTGVYANKGMFRKVEKDWQMVYIARDESETYGSISWRLATETGLVMKSVGVRAVTAVYETGNIDWTIQFDDLDPLRAKFGESVTEFQQRCSRVGVRAGASGGTGACAWQHAQLFRSPLPSATLPPPAPPLEIYALVDREQ